MPSASPHADAPLAVAITGASGVIYGIRLLQALAAAQVPAHLVLSESGARTITLETDWKLDDVRALAGTVHAVKDIGAALASGSFPTRGMVVAPCSIKTLSGIANSYNDNLVTRAADVTLKERRLLVLMVRETPLHLGHLDLMRRCTELGAVVMPPMPAFYHRPRTIEDIVDQGVGKVLDLFAVDHDLFERWSGG
ncbi:MAG: UbiX family flavin prenyltransferase [Hyphomicrobiales bacterium]|nr:UbiX family flavin prenyltransferase [Hyphomicrobiales bacterium]